ncbi:desmoglein-2-like [Heptranchias perlo]|uniref:desmoglein-2-like n=1 Tax=Heptranchias perlo TaxID=212740 RepID=UPI0035597239
MATGAGISRAGLVSLFLLATYCRVGHCSCNRGFSKRKIEAVIHPQVSKGEVVLTVQFHDCGLGRNTQLSTSDSSFEVHFDGSVHATQAQTIDSKYEFKVLADDLETNETWAVDVQLVSSKKTELVKRSPNVIRFPAKSNSRWQKREWIFLPVGIREHEPPMNNPIVIIKSDQEEEKDTIITYVITGPGITEPPKGLFVLDQRTGELNITGEVDREKNPFFILTGEAFDQYNVQREASIDITIKVIDINDNAPVFTQEIFQGSVEELSPFGTFAMKLNATDADEGDNAIVHYKFISQGNKEQFTILYTGEIKVTSPNLDRETQDLYTFTVEARDQSGSVQGLFATATAQIRILDVNDNIPSIEKFEYEETVSENTKNHQVVRIKVLDKDQEFTDNWLGHFDIIEGDEGKHFRFEMDNQTNEGILILQKELNYEEVKLVSLTVRVSNQAPYHSSVSQANTVNSIQIKIKVKNVKEGFEFRPSKWLISITESLTIKELHQVFGTYRAVSVDTGKEHKSTKYAKNTDPANWLVINSETGEVTFVGVPDRESKYVINGSYTATILAINNEGSSTTTATGTIVLTIQDVNDNFPNIVNLQPCMCDNAKSLNVVAVDPDGPPYGAPFRFNIGSDKKWKLGHTDATSMELVPLIDLWPGTFTVPVSIADNAGKVNVTNLNINVVECRDTTMCNSEKLIQTTNAALGGAAVGLMILGLLLLLLVPFLLLFCNCGGGGVGGLGGKRGLFVIPNEPKGVLAKSNIEGGGPVDTMVPLIYPQQLTGINQHEERMVGAGMGRRGHFGFESKNVERDQKIISKEGSEHQISWRIGDVRNSEAGSGRLDLTHNQDVWYNVRRGSQGDRSWSNGGMMEGANMAHMEKCINEKLLWSAEVNKSYTSHDCLLVYSNEGKNSPVGSLGSCSFIEEVVQDDSFLNDLDPKFKTLAEICIGKSESQSSAISTFKTRESATRADPLTQQNRVVEEESVSSNAVKLQGMTVNPSLVQKHIVVTTTISPGREELQGETDAVFVQRNVMANIISDNEELQRSSSTTDPAFVQKKPGITKAIYGMGGMQGTITNPSFTPIPVVQKNVVVTRSVNSGTGGIQDMFTGPLIGQTPLIEKNVVVTRSVNSGTGGMQDMFTDPLIGQTPLIEKNVVVTRSVNSGTGGMQDMFTDPLIGQTSLIEKNVVVTRSVNSGTGGMQNFNFSTQPPIEKNLGASISDDRTYRSVKKVTKTVQLVQE